MLKIKKNVDMEELKNKYNFYEEFYEYDYDYSNDGDIILEKEDSGVFIDKIRREIFGVDNSKLDLLYDLIKSNLVEKVDDKNA